MNHGLVLETDNYGAGLKLLGNDVDRSVQGHTSREGGQIYSQEF
jgi:hypothetical protein